MADLKRINEALGFYLRPKPYFTRRSERSTFRGHALHERFITLHVETRGGYTPKGDTEKIIFLIYPIFRRKTSCPLSP